MAVPMRATAGAPEVGKAVREQRPCQKHSSQLFAFLCCRSKKLWALFIAQIRYKKIIFLMRDLMNVPNSPPC